MPLWGKAKEKAEEAKEKLDDATANTFDPNKLPKKTSLPEGMQKIVDKADNDSRFYDEIRQGYGPDSTESNVRYAAYATRIRTIMLSAHRYVAYTSDIGESFRPVAHPNIIKAAYGISWLYILGDVSHEGYRAYWHNQRAKNPLIELTPQQEKLSGVKAKPEAVPAGSDPLGAMPRAVPALEDYRTVMAQRAIFQSLASMGLPALTIHSVVRYSGRALKDAKNKTLRTWGPIGLGLAVVPLLPTLFDEPVETAVEWVFHKGFQTFGGQKAVGDAPSTGREQALSEKPKKEKEL